MSAPEMPEPGDRAVLYWPPTYDDGDLIGGVVVVRDDTAPDSEAGAHWYAYGLDADGDPMTWADLWAWGYQGGAPVDEATVLTEPAAAEVEQLRQQLGEATDHLMAQGWAEVAAEMEAEARAAQPATVPAARWEEQRPNVWILYDTRITDPEISSAVARVYQRDDRVWRACWYLRDDESIGVHDRLTDAMHAAELAAIGEDATVPAEPTDAEYRPATDATGDRLWLHTCGALEAYATEEGPDTGYCDMCGENNTWTPLYKRRRVRKPQQSAEPTDAEVEAAARALFDTPPSEFHWDDLSDAAKPQWRRVACAALTAAARVRAGQAVTP